MDADCKQSRRDQALSRRENRWSMNSQRLEEIVAELMKPISDVRRSFDTDLSALLEEYLTEAGLHALEAEDAGDEASATPNFAELALLLQHSASLYGRKVDFLYQHVIDVSESLHNSTQEPNPSGPEGEPHTPSSSKRRRKASAADGGWGEIELEACVGAAREVSVARPPPTLPRMYVELEPRVLTDKDVQLHDYHGEPIGLLTDFHVTWRLQEGLLVEELEDGPGCEGERALRPLSLVELQQALEANAPPLPPLPPPPLGASTPLPPQAPPSPPASPAPPLPPTQVRSDRKRKNDLNIDNIWEGGIKIVLGSEWRRKVRKVEEFSIPEEWIAKVVGDRKNHILSLRRRLRAHLTRPPNLEFRGFDIASPLDIGGFRGWSEGEAALGANEVKQLAPRLLDLDSDDDGFFEQSSNGDSDGSRADDSALPLPLPLNHTHSSCSCEDSGVGGGSGSGGGDWASWQAQVVRVAAEGEARGGVDVRRLGRGILDACQKRDCTPFLALLQEQAEHPADVSRLLLTTLFLANAGNVEIVRGAPRTLNSFSLRVLDTDERLYRAEASAEANASFLS